MGLRLLGAAAFVALVACGSSGTGTSGADAGAGAGGEDSPGEAGASSSSGGTAGEAAAGSSGDTNAAGTNGEAGAGPEIPPKLCTSSMPFGAAQPLETLNTTGHEAGPRLTPDELTIAYLCNDGDTARVCMAQRASATADFEPLLEAVSDGGGVPWLSDDGLALFYEDDLSLGLFFTQRDAASELFPPGQELTALAGFGDPYVIGGGNGRLYLSLLIPPDLYVAQLTDWQPGEPELVPGASTDERDVRPVLTPDELTLYFGAPAPSGAARLDIWVKERASRSQDFGDPVSVAELNTAEDEFPGWISPDGCRLYFDSGAAPRDLFVSERQH